MPVIMEMEQRSPEWYQARLGLPTASNFGKIVTPTGKISKSDYMNRLLAEYFTGKSDNTFTSKWMERGSELESEARAAYEFTTDTDVRQVGFVVKEDGSCGCSPDGLIGGDGGCEIKSPSAHVHVSYLRSKEVPGIYRPQVQGSLWVCKRTWWDWISYHPALPLLVVRVGRDEEYIKKLVDAMLEFTTTLKHEQEQLR